MLRRHELSDGVEDGFELDVVFGFHADEIRACGAFLGEVVVGGGRAAEALAARTTILQRLILSWRACSGVGCCGWLVVDWPVLTTVEQGAHNEGAFSLEYVFTTSTGLEECYRAAEPRQGRGTGMRLWIR